MFVSVVALWRPTHKRAALGSLKSRDFWEKERSRRGGVSGPQSRFSPKAARRKRTELNETPRLPESRFKATRGDRVMAAGRTRSTRRLRSWIVEQVGSGKYPGLVWDDDAKTMFRIPWKHAGKQDFRKDEDAAIFKAWAEFKGKLTDGGQDSPASWKTRLRCALNKSPEFMEMLERAQLDISEPYKVYRLVPLSEQGVVVPEKKKCRVKAMKRPRRKRRRSSSSSESESSDVEPLKQIKEEEVTSQLLVEDILPWSEIHVQMQEPAQPPAGAAAMHLVDEIQLDVRIEESVAVPAADHMSFSVAVHYLGREVLRREIQNSDVRIQYLPSSPAAPAMAAVMTGRFPRIPLPEPASALLAGPDLQALSTLLPFMVRGVALTSTPLGVYGTRFCQGRVFWAGPHESTPGPHKMERCLEPVLLFCKDTFRRQLEQYRLNGGEPPQSAITLCFGEELSEADDPSRKLIIVKICFPWAQQQVYNTQSIFSSINMLHSLASESPLGEITLNLVSVPVEDSQTASCGGGSFQNKRQLTLSE